MRDASVSEQLHEFFRAFDRGDVASLLQHITDDIELRLGNADASTGKPAFARAVEWFHGSVAGVRHDILSVYVDGEMAIVEFVVHYTRHDQLVVSLPCCNVFRLRQGLIAEYRSYVDATSVYAP